MCFERRLLSPLANEPGPNPQPALALLNKSNQMKSLNLAGINLRES